MSPVTHCSAHRYLHSGFSSLSAALIVRRQGSCQNVRPDGAFVHRLICIPHLCQILKSCLSLFLRMIHSPSNGVTRFQKSVRSYCSTAFAVSDRVSLMIYESMSDEPILHIFFAGILAAIAPLFGAPVFTCRFPRPEGGWTFERCRTQPCRLRTSE